MMGISLPHHRSPPKRTEKPRAKGLSPPSSLRGFFLSGPSQTSPEGLFASCGEGSLVCAQPCFRVYSIATGWGRPAYSASRSCRHLSRDDCLPDWPQREASELHMSPREWDSNDGYGQHDRRYEV